MNGSIAYDFKESELENDINLTYGFIWLAVTVTIVISFPAIYKKVRCRFPVTVNCWFCNKYTRVPYNEINCWDCPFCEQYNGFNKDGGYNKVIKEQYSPSLNNAKYNVSTKPLFIKDIRNKKFTSNGFCNLCNINQQLKIQQLAHFVPIDEGNYDSELEHFRQQLEKSYKLCSSCERTLEKVLHTQQYDLLKSRLNVQKEHSQFLKLNNISSCYEYQQILILLRKTLYSGLKFTSGIITLVMFFSFVFQLETEQHFLKATLPDLSFLVNESLLQEILHYLTYSYDMKKELISVALLCYVLSSFFRRGRYDHPSVLLFWGILYVSCWSNLTGLQVLLSGTSLILNIIEIQKTQNYSLKKLSRSKIENFQDENGSRISSFDTSTNSVSELNNDKTKLNKTKNKRNDKIKGKCDEVKFEKPVEEISNYETPMMKPKIARNKSSESQTIPIKTKTVFNKTFLSSLDNERNEKELSPPPEIFHDLTNLHISNNLSFSNKPCNFLFEKHNFDDKYKKNSSVIKSPKFVKSSSNLWVSGELNETISRSSTPSSGYSSQKPDKTDLRQHSFDFPKVISPVSFGRSSPPENFDYWDRNHSCFNTNNLHCFTPGCLPFQQFPNSLGHTTVYTYTRPTNFPYSFSPSHNAQGYTYSPDLHLPRFSDASESENLFQNASKSYQLNKKWSVIKNFFYNISLIFNIISTCILAYFTWTGVISLTGN